LADLVYPAGLNVGDQFHYAFKTDGTMAPLSVDIAVYNTFVTAEAERAGAITETFGITWNVIGSTATVDARDNALVQAPVYLVNGTTKIADGFTDIWDGSIQNPLNITQFGAIGNVSIPVYTGTIAAGTKAPPGLHFGGGLVARIGNQNAVNSTWVDWHNVGDVSPRAYYAMSELVTVVPEPGSLSFMSIGAIGLIGCGRRRRPRSRRR
jgi:hypothetical protein